MTYQLLNPYTFQVFTFILSPYYQHTFCKLLKLLKFYTVQLFHCNSSLVFQLVTVRSLAPICRSTTGTMVSEAWYMQIHTVRYRLIKRTRSYVGFLGTCRVLWEYRTSPHCHSRLDSWSQDLWGFTIPFCLFCGITDCGSASLKLCVCNAASPWRQSSSPDSQWAG